MKPRRDPQLDRLDGQLMPDVVRPDAFLPYYFAALRDDDVSHVHINDLWSPSIISKAGLHILRKTEKYSNKLMTTKMHRQAFDEAVKEGRLELAEYGTPFRLLVEWALSKDYVPRGALYSALYAKEPHWDRVALAPTDWPLRNAVCYVLGRAPLRDANLESYKLQPDSLLIDEERLFKTAIRAIDIEELSAWLEHNFVWDEDEWYVKPQDFCRWFRDKGLVLPEPLNRLADGDYPLIQNREVAERASDSDGSEVYTEIQTRIIEELSREPMTCPDLHATLLRIDSADSTLDEKTVKRALAFLKKQGVVANKRGLGYYLVEKPPKPSLDAD